MHEINMDISSIFISLVIGYLLGSIPFGLLLAKAFGQGDIRDIGSGNIGATNVLRTGRKDIAALTLLLDAGKAGIAGLIVGHFIGAPYAFIAAASAFLGHCFPVWLKFKGGKGVATFFGALLALVWPVGLIAAITWLIIAFVTRYSSLAALWAAGLAPIAALLLGYQNAAFMSAFMALLIFMRHRENIGRLIKGEESKIGGSKAKASETQTSDTP
ncbi:MAG: glycerol-3-phosphate 1-O-acyltransferase PlsY [Litorimonas sp.]